MVGWLVPVCDSFVHNTQSTPFQHLRCSCLACYAMAATALIEAAQHKNHSDVHECHVRSPASSIGVEMRSEGGRSRSVRYIASKFACHDQKKMALKTIIKSIKMTATSRKTMHRIVRLCFWVFSACTNCFTPSSTFVATCKRQDISGNTKQSLYNADFAYAVRWSHCYAFCFAETLTDKCVPMAYIDL